MNDERRSARTPTSTYRLQITSQFDLYAAARTLPYLHALGVDWVYLSPVLAAEPGSDHGYDVVGHNGIDLSRGGPAGLQAVSARARSLGMGVLVDIVPNHVGVATPAENAWWWSLLAAGHASPWADAFDVDWEAGGGRIRIPVVGDDDLGADGAVGNLRVVDGELRYHDHRFPVRPGTLALVDGTPDAQATHAAQHYELVGWRTADDRLNYRRFFAVNTLAAVRVEDRRWFDATHAEVKRWFAEGLVDGLRVDHPDGLRDPAGYLDDLAGITGGAYVLVEKILEPGEELEPSWATAGTTGYDALALVDRLFVDPAGEAPLDALEASLRGAPVEWHAMVHDRKREVADGILGSEVRRISRELGDDGDEVVDAVAELVSGMPVYRSYLPAGRDHLEEAFTSARRHRPDLDAVLDRLHPLLTDPEHPAALRFQQTSGMVMAKGVEDCSFYRWSRLTSLNEVGADPSVFAVDAATFHAAMTERQEHWPHAMTTMSTHDTKRGEDVRARISVLAELPDLWAGALSELLEAAPLPDPGFGALLWQAIVGAWPATSSGDLRSRLHAYAEKAMREAGDGTTWTAPDEDYEAAVHRAVDAAFDDRDARRTLVTLLDAVTGPGWSNALAAKLVALTIPGVPDVYQGSELWEQSLVDPDNRRPVDFDVRSEVLPALLGGVRPPLAGGLADSGAVKLRLVATVLRLRRDRPELFSSYAPLAAEGEAADHLVAFDRGGAVSVVTRLPVGLGRRGGWGTTTLELPEGEWRDLLADAPVARDASGRVLVADLLATYPVALLTRESA
ncbi:malto-oligosyltrehalose synthase [Nocardioides sp. ChNu-153]|uniref:malto-oligosyltrehalose synthase n=1 Tax=unclassified Nocardioides TaxID=2615069 RepID=UPI00240697C7|nr:MULTISPECIES: malto-oligosyltrehalose synthase [unclassified Nocardioides]MDF9716503.1 malto-oligosyltrehalose synthase [Nocardioides sp. ChNu-99]MDN7122078.1 malto-oligosyltrehalose synthase [Nocardioides sp. ChNu-153]